MKFFRTLAIAFLCTMVLSGSASAAWLSEQDTTVSLTLLPNILTTSSSTGSLTFAAQEAVHDQITDLTGLSVDHYYLWVNVNGQPVAAVDPVTFYTIR